MDKIIPIIAILIIVFPILIIFLNKSNKPATNQTFVFGEPLNELERMIIEVNKSSDGTETFLQSFKELEIFALGITDEPIEGSVTLEKDMGVKFKGMADGERLYIPVFTAIERIQQSGLGGEHYIGMKAGMFFDMLEPNVIVMLNPHFDSEMRFFFDEDSKAWHMAIRNVQ